MRKTTERVRTEQGREAAFRFYDPRVLNIYLPTCRHEEFKAVLGPVTRLIAESPGGHSMPVFELDGGVTTSFGDRSFALA